MLFPPLMQIGVAILVLSKSGDCSKVKKNKRNYEDTTNQNIVPKSCKEKDILVIGAGLSGMAAARDLQDRGCKVKVYEARGQTGGRSRTEKDNLPPWDFPHDLGGTFQHGSSQANSITWLADRFDIKRAYVGGDSAYGERNSTVWIRNSDGKPYSRGIVDESFDLHDEWWKLNTKYLRQIRKKKLKIQKSLKDSSEYIFNTVMSLSRDQQALQDAHITSNFDNDFGVEHSLWPLDGIDKRDGWWWKPISGPDYYLPDGMSQVIDLLEDGDSSNEKTKSLQVNLNHVVKKIEHSKKGCTIYFYNNGDSKKLFKKKGSACIVTVPLGVLIESVESKTAGAGSIEFEPKLSIEKQLAIRNRNLSHYSFMLLQFPEPFWKDIDPGKNFWIRAIPRKNCVRDPGHVFKESEVWRDMSHSRNGKTHYILESLFGGDRYWAQDLSDKEMEELFLRGLKKYFGKKKVPKPISFKTYRWTLDEFSRGSYSGMSIVSTDQEWYDLATPESNGLYFAGEHTNYDGRSATLDGAYNTGIREAERISTSKWNIDTVSQKSMWANANAFTSGW
eukprot:CAMPEP_0113316460 /NCGR_PEP_ID=MMETSP0010_2-20120614/11726_1 /TAXON_ID=216773 ORGANISM="Corethron hystrix, Strain 308" /NCGR_SAMPLE_ID=MMETSP0010_2 /ASSEMBLY_ACC=CAM_ASM_000155 /LENGTH=558 /DNA_ID=CAMNT_0000173179 /DNA_START=151 /DNA_END=1824 /DNA_ORIENTATION=- /assembly_acc=CAM_ASM_000155